MENEHSSETPAYEKQQNEKNGYDRETTAYRKSQDEEKPLPDFKPVDMNLDGLEKFASDKDCGYETDAELLLKNASYVLEPDESFKISEEVQKQIEDYLDETYQVKKVTAFYCSQIVKKGTLCEDKWQYTAYVKLLGATAKKQTLKESEEPRQPSVLESWYVFEGDTKSAQFISAFEPN